MEKTMEKEYTFYNVIIIFIKLTEYLCFSVLVHFNPKETIQLKTNASAYVIADILSQLL